MAEAFTTDCRKGWQRRRNQSQRFRPDVKVETLLEANRTENPRSVIVEADGVQHANYPGAQVTLATKGIEQHAESGRKLNRHRVDGEIASAQIIFNAGRLHHRQCAGFWIRFPAGSDQINERWITFGRCCPSCRTKI